MSLELQDEPIYAKFNIYLTVAKDVESECDIWSVATLFALDNMSHVTRKPVFWGLRPVKTQTSLLSDRE